MIKPASKYLPTEGKRNRANAALFQALLTRAFGECSVIVGHHVSFQFGGDLETEDEIPSADTLLFDHSIMGACFGSPHCLDVMQAIAILKPGEREAYVLARLEAMQ